MRCRGQLFLHLAIAGVTAILLTSCRSGSVNEVTSTTVTRQPSQVQRSSDGILRIGVLVPLTDEQAPFGPPLVPVVEAFLRIMNSIGGFNDRDVEWVIRDEGPNPDTARKAAKQLITADQVDVVLGPFSSVNAPSVVPLFTAVGIGVCSPSVSTPVFDALSDDRLFIRTATLDSELVGNMVTLATGSGSPSISLAFPDDPYGRSLAQIVRKAVDEQGLSIISENAYPIAAPDYVEIATAMATDDSPVDLIITDPVDGLRFLNTVIAASDGSTVITNDTLIGSQVTFAPEERESPRPRVIAVAGDANNGSNELLNLIRLSDKTFDKEITQLPAFAVNTIDCLTLMWLAAVETETDDAQIFKDEFTSVANVGSSCLWLTDCRFAIQEKLNLDYQGISGLDLDDAGNAVGKPALFFEFNDDGRAQLVQGIPNVTLTS